MNDGEFEDTTLIGNDIIKKAIHEYYQEQTEHRFMGICMAVRNRIVQDGHLLFPVDVGVDEDAGQTFEFKNLELDGQPVMVAFTSIEEKEKGPEAGGLSTFIESVLEPLLQMDEIAGLLINPWGESICLGKEDIAMILTPGSERFI
jgi:hypothetical protein